MTRIPYSDIEFDHGTATNQDSGKQIAVTQAIHRHTGKFLGEIEWHAHTGEISWIGTTEEHRHMGVATHMLSAAKSAAAQYGISAPKMSPVHTADGAAWAKSVGLPIPAKLSGICRDCSTLRSETGYCPCYHRSYQLGRTFTDLDGKVTGSPGGPKIGGKTYRWDEENE